MSKGLSIVGSSRVNGDRSEGDFYPTPRHVTEALIAREGFSGLTWECACGDGAISSVLEERGLQVVSSDLVNRGYGRTFDFLTSLERADNIITNPPYKMASEFIRHAKKQADAKVAMFLRTAFLEGSTRYAMFNDTAFPLKTVYQFSKRVTLCKPGANIKTGGMIAYAWFVWDKSHKGKPTIEWIL